MLTKTLKAILPTSAINLLRRWKITFNQIKEGHLSSAEFWSRHHVDAPDEGFATVEASLAHLTWRNRQYPSHLDLMPVHDADGLVVLDYGCGPGNDVVGFGIHSKPKAQLAFDISPKGIALAKNRAQLHGLDVHFDVLPETSVALPLEDNSVDLIHCAGVLHHTPDPGAILQEFRRVLKPTGHAQIMVYNRDSVWMHLHVAYEMRILNQLYGDVTKEDAFARTTDGETCPIARCYRPQEFIELAQDNGFKTKFIGASISVFEMQRMAMIYDALKDQRLDEESAAFLEKLTFNDRHWPLIDGQVAGINGYFHLHP